MNAMTSALAAAGVLNATDTANGSNQPPVDYKASLFKRAREFGENEGKGNNAKPSLYLGVTEAASLHGVTSDGEDAAAIYAEYSKGRAKTKGVGWVEDKSTPQQVSKVKTMIKLGELVNVDGVALNTRVANKITDMVRLGQKLDKSAGDIILTAARMQIGQPDAPLTDEQIEEAFIKSTPDQKIEADILGAIRDACEKRVKDGKVPLSEDSKALLDTIVSDLAARVKELGGTMKDRKALEKAMRAKIEAEVRAEKLQAAVGGNAPLPGGVARY